MTLLPMLFVTATTMTAGVQMVSGQFPALVRAGAEAGNNYLVLKGTLSIAMTVFVIACVASLLLMAVSRWVAVLAGAVPVRPESEEADPVSVPGIGVSPEGAAVNSQGRQPLEQRPQ